MIYWFQSNKYNRSGFPSFFQSWKNIANQLFSSKGHHKKWSQNAYKSTTTYTIYTTAFFQSFLDGRPSIVGPPVRHFIGHHWPRRPGIGWLSWSLHLQMERWKTNGGMHQCLAVLHTKFRGWDPSPRPQPQLSSYLEDGHF